VSPIKTLVDSSILQNSRFVGNVSPTITLTGKDTRVSNNRFDRPVGGGNLNQVIFYTDGCIAPIAEGNYFDGTGYQFIQDTGAATHGQRIYGNTAIDCGSDFVLQNNDSQPGISHSWLVALNFADATNSVKPYGTVEARGIGFTSCYGGINAINAMVAIKGDAATHLENIQETMHGFNYFRDCFRDMYWSGERRRLMNLTGITGTDTLEVGDEIVGDSSGATAYVLFYLENYGAIQDVDRVGAFTEGETFTITSKDTTGTISYIDPVQVHANAIGNIFHKTNDETRSALHLGVNGYQIRSHFIGNIYNAQVEKGVADNQAVVCAASYDSDHSLSSYRGWDTVFNGGTFTGEINIKDSYFWNNTLNLDGDAWQSPVLTGNKFFDGKVRMGNVVDGRFENNTFVAGEIDIDNSGSGSKWINNRVAAGVTLTDLDPSTFGVWESQAYKKNGETHKIVSTTNINSGSTLKELIATLEVAGGNRSAVVEWKLTARSAALGGRMNCDMGRAFIEWNENSVPTIVLDSNNFAEGFITTEFSLDISGNDVLLNYDYQVDNTNSFVEIEISIVTAAVKVTPVDFLDLI
jgi:hypothetical protein